MALQRTRRPRIRSGRSLRSLGSPLNARLLGGLRRNLTMPLVGLLLSAVSGFSAPLFRSRAERGVLVAVVDRSGAALPGVTVVVDLVPPSGTRPALFQATTDPWGEAAIPAVPPGTYNIRACLTGLYVDYEARVRIMQNRPAYVLLSMDVGETADPSCPRPTATSPEPSGPPPLLIGAPQRLPEIPVRRTFRSLR
jgi:hypothetical protein